MQVTLKIAERIAEIGGIMLFGAGTATDMAHSESWAELVRELGMAGIVLILLGGAFWITRQVVANWIDEQKHGREMTQATVRNMTKMVELVDDLKNTLQGHSDLLHRIIEHNASVVPVVNRIEERQKQND